MQPYFEICAALDEQGLDIQAVLDGLEITLVPIVEEQISKLVLTIVAAINDLLGTSIVLTPEEVIDAVDIDAIVAQITANVQVSLGILEACLDLPPTPPPCEVTVDTITTGIGELPIGIAYDSENERMYVTNSADGTVSIIDTRTNTVIDTIDLGGLPTDIAYDSENERMYVTNSAGGTVTVIDTNTNTVEPTPITVGNAPLGIAFDLEQGRMYVANNGDGTVSVIDTATNNVIDTNSTIPGITPIPVGSAPVGIAYDSIT